MVTVEYDRLVRWAANRIVGDSLLREIAHDYARTRWIISGFQTTVDKDSVIMERQAEEIQGWKDQSAYCDRERAKDRKRAKGAKVWRFLEGIAVGAAVGIILAR